MTTDEASITQGAVARAAFAFAVAGALIAGVVVGYAWLETWGLRFPVREILAGLLAGGVATLGLRRTVGFYAACAIGFVGIAFGTPVMLVSLQAGPSDSAFDTISWFASFQGGCFAVLGVGIGRAIGRSVLRVGLPVAACGALAGVVMAMPFTSLRPRSESADGWIAAGLVVSLAIAGAWAGYVLARRGGVFPRV